MTGLALAGSAVQADKMVKSRTINCDKGQDPSAILELNPGPQPLVLVLEGTCPGFAIERDAVTVTADDENGCPAATVDGTIVVRGQRTTISCLTVTGSGPGVVVENAAAQIRDSSMSGNDQVGVSAAQAIVSVTGGEISGNVGAGVTATSSRVGITGADVTNNAGEGLAATTNSSADIDQAYISGNTGSDLFLSLHSVATGQGNTIGTINVQLDSGVSLDGSISGPFGCADTESSVLINGVVPAGCTGF